MKNVLILGASGRFGRHCHIAFGEAGWAVHKFQRDKDDLKEAVKGKDVVIFGSNPPYPKWASEYPKIVDWLIDAMEGSQARLVIPGNVYVFGENAPLPWGAATPHLAENPLGLIRRDLEKRFRESGIKTLILRAGDFIDTQASGNWFDLVITKQVRKGRLTYPGRDDIPHSWAYLPDMARAALMLCESELPDFVDTPFAGYKLSGEELAAEISGILDRQIRCEIMNWLPIRIASPFWPMAAKLLEMRYLWDTPHWLDGARLKQYLPDFKETPINEALKKALTSAPHP